MNVNIAERVWSHAEVVPDRTAVRSRHGDLTYRDLRQAAACVAGAVSQLGARPLERVILVAPSVLEFPIAYYGLQALGASVITMNTMSTVPEIEHVIDDAAASLVVAWHECATAASVAAGRRGVTFMQIDQGARFDAHPLETLYDHDPDDTAVILYTSGTSGRPKGVELTVANLLATTEAIATALQIGPEDRYGTALPLFHVFGQAIVMNTMLANQVTLSLLSPFDSVQMLELIRDHRLTGVSGVPTMWNAMLHASDEFCRDDFRHLRFATSGGAAMPVEVMRAFEDRFGCPILEGYGLTETAGAATVSLVGRAPRPGTVGTVLPGFEIQARGTNGQVVPQGEVGELFIMGPSVMKGYWGLPDATRTDLIDGWLRTGDLGAFDGDGYLRIVDRSKDLIIRGGYNVYPREVEEVLYMHPDIVEAAVVGVPDDRLGEEVAAAVVLRPGTSFDATTLRSWAKEHLSAYKVPRIFEFVEQLPKGPTGKILKREIDMSSQHPDRTAPR